MATVMVTDMAPLKATRVTAHLRVMKVMVRTVKANAATAMAARRVTAKANAVAVAVRSACSRWFR